MRKLSLSLVMSCSLTIFACRGQGEREQSPPESQSSESSDSKKKKGDDDANPFAAMAGNPFAAMLTKKLDEPGPYDAPKQSANYDETAPHLRVLKLTGSVAELEAFDLLAFGGGGALRTRAILDELDELAAEDKLEGLVLRVGDLSTDMAHATELRRALLEFRGDGARQLLCHAEHLDNVSFYLLSVCDELAMVPVGDLMIPGPAATPIHLKGLLDKLGVQPDFLHVGAFKGAAEPLTRDAPSPEMLETLGAVVDQAYATLVDGIAGGRKRSADEVRGWIDRGLYTAEDADAAGLIDGVEAWEPFLARVVGERGWKLAELGEKPWSDPAALQRFLGLAPPKRPSEPHVALVYAVGNIIDGKGRGALGASGEIASAQLVPVLDRLAADDKVAAVVLRVDSGGGSARASEQIWHAVERLKGKKPVVVSMAGVAASGGYYISANATKIFAESDTLTGSIGVVGGKIVIGPALEQLGIKTYAVAKGEHALMWSAMQPWTEGERQAVYAMMEQTYEAFLERVALGRGMQRDAVHEIAQGRVWTGQAALERGLVDEIGGLEAALAEAAKLAGVELGVGIEAYPGDPTIKDILGSFDQLVSVDTELGPFAAVLGQVELVLGPNQRGVVEGLRRALGTLVAMRGSSVWAVEWLRPL